MQTPEKLSHVGLKVTGPRLLVLNVFHEHERAHLTADDVHRWTVERGPRIPLATLYRVLNDLTEVGILSRTVLEGRPAVYELQQDHHHDHIVCRECGRVDAFTDGEITRRSRAIADSRGYAISSHQLALYGHCSECLSTRTNPT